MRIKDHLLEKHKKDKPSKKKSEKVNWHEIMGSNRDTFRRGKGGAIRRK